MNDLLCEICGCKAIKLYGYTPLCKNPACEEALIDIINGDLIAYKGEEDDAIYQPTGD